MSDTVIWGKTFSGVLKGALLYVLIDVCLSLSTAMLSMKQTDWDAMWWMQRSGWWLAQLGSAGLVFKAYYSKSAKA